MNLLPRFPLLTGSVLLASFGSIALLLAHVSGLGTMHQLLWPVGIPCMVWLAAAWLLARSRGDHGLTQRLRLGLVGGWWGTVGYDVVRVPLHMMGLNPFPPIRAYGMWVSGVDHATPWTDLAGFTYHISNGITFGIMYALLMTGQHWAWGVFWGIALEMFAVMTPFGELFGLRSVSQPVIIAFVAHLFYGYPLGRICETRASSGLSASVPWAGSSIALLAAWFVLAWQPVAGYPELSGDILRFGPDAVYPGVRDASAASHLVLQNDSGKELKVKVRSTKEAHGSGDEVILPTAGRLTWAGKDGGLYQFAVPGTTWRSAWVFVWKEHKP